MDGRVKPGDDDGVSVDAEILGPSLRAKRSNPGRMTRAQGTHATFHIHSVR
jgi:hypothetical protein